MHLCPTVIETYVELLILALLWLASNKTGRVSRFVRVNLYAKNEVRYMRAEYLRRMI